MTRRRKIALQSLDRVFRDLAGAVEAAEVVDVDEHHDVAAGKRIAQMPRPALSRGLIAIGPVKQVLRNSPRTRPSTLTARVLGDSQCQDQGCLLARHERELLVMGRVIEHRDVAEHLPPGGLGRSGAP